MGYVIEFDIAVFRAHGIEKRESVEVIISDENQSLITPRILAAVVDRHIHCSRLYLEVHTYYARYNSHDFNYV